MMGVVPGASAYPTDLPFAAPGTGPFGRPLKRERGAKIPVIIVTGFLGAGKTTLIRAFLNHPEGAGTAVIVNEFGAVGIDDALLRQASESVALIGNGCLCCNIRSDLQRTLHGLVAERDRGTIPRFSRIIIETSGLADPNPILASFATDRALGGVFHAEAVIAVVPVAGGAETIAGFAEARRQILLADRIVLSKCDIADADAAEVLTAMIRRINPRAGIVAAANGSLDPQWILADGAGLFASGFIAAETAHTDGISSFTLVEHAPVAWTAFARTMETLIALRGADLLRVKGLLHVAGRTGPVVVQFVRHLAHPPVELALWPGGDRSSRVVFIARNVSERQVKDLFAAVQAIAASP